MSRCTWDTARALEPFAYRIITFYDPSFQKGSARLSGPTSRSRYPLRRISGFRLFRFRSPLLPKSWLLSFPPLTKMFQFSGLSPLDFSKDDAVLTAPGFPIRRPPDQSYLDSSPRLFAANRVLRRLAVPRYSLCAAVT